MYIVKTNAAAARAGRRKNEIRRLVDATTSILELRRLFPYHKVKASVDAQYYYILSYASSLQQNGAEKCPPFAFV